MTDMNNFLEILAAKYGQGSIVTNRNVYDTAIELGIPPPHRFFRQHLSVGRGQWRLASNLNKSEPVMDTETDDQVSNRIADRFTTMSGMVDATVAGRNRAVIISGPPGVGKSHSIIQALQDLDESMWTIVKGFVRPTGLYKTLYEYREHGQVVVFDDADSIFFDDISLNILKSACDSTRTRRLSWLAETKMEDEAGERLPRSFEFNGSIVFLTNYDFDTIIARNGKLAPHFEAMISRSHYVDLALKTPREYLIRIRQVVMSGMLNDSGINNRQAEELMAFMTEKQSTIRELSLRMILKLADLMTISPHGWKKLAVITCCRAKQ